MNEKMRQQREYANHAALVPGSQAGGSMYLKNPASDDAFGSQSYKPAAAKDSNNGAAKPEGSHHTSSDPQSLPAYGALGDKDMKAGADA